MAAPRSSKSAAAAAADAPELPDAAVVAILRHLPQDVRLRDGALVCQAWASAAAVASDNICRSGMTQEEVSAFDAWLQRHAGHVTSVEIHVSWSVDDSSCRPLLRLPGEQLAARLQRLHLNGCHVQLQGGAALPHLVNLALCRCGLSEAVRELLPQLTQLTRLGMHASDAAAALGSLQQLRELHLAGLGGTGTEHISLPQGLTQLQLAGRVAPAQPVPTTPATAPSLCQLTSLQDLCLYLVNLDGGVLRRLTQLKTLVVADCKLLPLGPGMAMGEEPQPNSKAGSAALLSGLTDLTGLQSLKLADVPLYPDTDTAAQCSALTASSRLERLALLAEDVMPVPLGAAQHMFPAGRKLPALRHLRFDCAVCAPPDDDPLQPPVLSSACLRAIVSGCPALDELSLIHTVQPEADLGCLPQLAGTLSDLAVGGEAFGDAAAAHISQLAELEVLYWKPSPLTDVGVEQLTALDQLASLVVEQGGGISDALCNNDNEYTSRLALACVNDEAEPVWRQLWEMCEASPAVAVERLKQLRQEHEQLQASNARLHWEQLQSSRVRKRTQATQTHEPRAEGQAE